MENVNTQKEERTMEKSMEMTGTKKPKGWKAIVAGFFITILFLAVQATVSAVGTVVLVIGSMTSTGNYEPTQEELMASLAASGGVTILLMIASMIMALIAIIWYKLGYVKKYTAQDRALLRQEVCHVKPIASFVLAGIGCYNIALIIAAVINAVSPSSIEGFGEMMGLVLDGNAVLSFLFTVALAPITEEVIFRGIILRKLLKTNTAVVAIIAQALLFAFYHLNIVQALYVIPVALVLGYVAYRYHSVLPCILIHVVNNFMPVVVGLLPEAMQNIVTFLVVAIVCAGVVYWFKKSEMKKDECLNREEVIG